MVLQQSQRPSLLNVTLQTLQRFLTWVPLGYIFETPLIPLLNSKFFPVPIFRNATVECLTEIAGLSDCPEQYNPVFVQLYTQFLTGLGQLLQPDPSVLAAMYETDGGEHTLKLLALFFGSFFKAHLSILETPEMSEALNVGFMYLIGISEVEDPEIFKICLEYWHCFAHDLYTDDTSAARGVGGALALGMAGGGGAGGGVSRKMLYRTDLLTRLRTNLISNMARPEEVLIFEDENGDVVREQQKDTEVIAQYKTMREALVYLTHLNYEDTEAIMLDKLASQVDRDSQEWSWQNLNTLCWAIGSISGAMSEEEEKRFLVTVIKDLLGLCEEKRGKDNKAVIASNIMYVVGQYPRFLRAHWKFLKTVVNKLFEFMHEKHPGVQDMACETFLKIAQKCKRKFVTVQQHEHQPFIVELMMLVPSIILELESHQVHTFYEAAATMLSERTLPNSLQSPGMGASAGAGQQEQLDRSKCLMELMAQPNREWEGVMAQATQSAGESLKAPETARILLRFLKTNQRVCSAVGPLYVAELQVLFGDLMNVYTAFSEYQKAMVEASGEVATHHSLYKGMRGVKKETLRLLTTFVDKCGEPEAPPATVAASLLPVLLQATPSSVLGDYNRLPPAARDAEVLALFSTCITKLPLAEAEGGAAVPRILDALFDCTLQVSTRIYKKKVAWVLKFHFWVETWSCVSV
jgi:exportin-1